jgi:branched-chain amino acid transport system ATP-binding protein
MSALLELHDVEVKYGNITAVKRVNLSVDKGEVVCLIGANGAGKSSLLKAIVGMEPLTSGNIVFDGEAIAGKTGFSIDKIVAKGIALVPEGRRVFTDMTILENLEMGAFLSKDESYVKMKLEAMFGLFPILAERRKQKAGSLSGGEQQMLAIARALMSSPRLLLLDEPGLGLAPLVVKSIFETISQINRTEGLRYSSWNKTPSSPSLPLSAAT